MTLKTKIKIRPANILHQIQRAEDGVRIDFSHFIEKIERVGLRIYKNEVPVHTGRLRNSVKTIKKTKQGGGLDLRSNIEIGPTVPYAQYPDKGANPSPGAYVKILGVRIKFGMHPGQKAQNYNREATEKFREQSDRLLKSELGNKVRERIGKVGK